MNEYTVYYYNTIERYNTYTTIRASSAEVAIYNFAKTQGDFTDGKLSFTRKLQNAEDVALRDNAHAQCDGSGTRGYAACRKGYEKQYCE